MKAFGRLTVIVFLLCAAVESRAKPVSLAGTWRFEVDRRDTGVAEQWFNRELAGKMPLPGAMSEFGLGDEITLDTPWTGQIVDRSYFTSPTFERYRQPGHIKIPFWLQPTKYYVGPAWYQREIEIPAGRQGRRVVLFLERPHWETRVWLDAKFAGSNNGLSMAHTYDLGTGLAPGKHRLTIRVDNRLVVDVGINSHSVSDHTQGNWNGIAGRIELEDTPPVWVEDLEVYPHVASRSVTVKGRIGNATGAAGAGSVTLVARSSNVPQPGKVAEKACDVRWQTQGGEFQVELPLGDGALLWDEFQPALYRLDATLDRGKTVRSVTFGLREIGTLGTQFTLNGRKIYFRGTLECAIFPRTGHPPTDTESWKKIIRAAKVHGLNQIRFHSWCPPEAAFVAADELGFYYQVECASWANSSTSVGEGKPIDTWLYAETDRILRAYGNHPSFLLMPYGNEPAGKDREYLGAWVDHYKARDSRRLFTSASGWPLIPQNQFHVTPNPRIQGWGEGLKSRINARAPETRTDYRDYIQKWPVPVISHEIGQWCVYPNFAEMAKYTGYLKPRNFEIFKESLREHGMLDQARDFLWASGRLQTLCYKEEIEAALRTPGMGGFQLLDLHDFPGQGTALVGVLDPFWESKGYVTAKEFHRFCGPTVPLARLGKRVWTANEILEAAVEVAHFGPAPLTKAAPRWKLMDDRNKTWASGQLETRDIPVDNGIALGTIHAPLASLPAPARYRLVVSLAGVAENDWDLWVYPEKVDAAVPAEVQVVEDLDDRAAATLQAGGKVLWMPLPGRARGDSLGPVALGFSSIFWNTAWTQRQAPHTLGVLCDPRHPALAGFPTDRCSNWQWWYLIHRSQALILDDLPSTLHPVVQVIDDWVTNRKLGLLFEARVGPGKLMVCAMDLRGDLAEDPVARQMKRSVLAYMAGAKFQPAVDVTLDRARQLVAPPVAR